MPKPEHKYEPTRAPHLESAAPQREESQELSDAAFDGAADSVASGGEGVLPPPAHIPRALDRGDGAARERTLNQMQQMQGNAYVARVVQRKLAVQRIFGLGIGNQPPRTPPQATDPEVVLKKYRDPEYAKRQLSEAHMAGGPNRALEIINQIGQEVQGVQPSSKDEVLKVWNDQNAKLNKYRETYANTFQSNALGTVDTMLNTSEKAIEDERKRYGIAEKMEVQVGGHVQGTGKYVGQQNNDTKKLAEAAQHLMKLGTEFVNMEIKIKEGYRKQHPVAPQDQQKQDQDAQAALMANQEYLTKVQEYEKNFAKYSAEFPIIAAFKNNPAQLGALAAVGRSPEAATIVGKTLQEKQDNIGETRTNLHGGKLDIWSLPNVIKGAKAQYKVAPDSLENAIIDQEVAKRQKESEEKKKAIMALTMAVGMVAAIATAGGSLVIAAGATGFGIGVGAAQALDEINNYRVMEPASNTALDRAKSISAEDPSLLWLAIDIAAVILDVVQAGKIFKQAAGPVRSFLSARKALEKGGKLATEEAEQLAKQFKSEVEPALKELPEDARAGLKQKLDPANALPSTVRGTLADVKWNFGELHSALKRSGGGAQSLVMQERFGVQVAYSKTGATWFDKEANTIFISQNLHPEDAAQGFIHEMTHAEWHHLGKTANVSDLTKISRPDYVRRMLREEAEAEANAIRHKFEAQWKLNRAVQGTSPVEKVYSDAAAEEMRKMLKANPNMDQATAMMRADIVAREEVFKEFQSGRVTHSLSGKAPESYVDYYGRVWDMAQPTTPW